MAERLANELLDASQRRRRLGEAPGRPAQDGRVEQGLRPLPLVEPPTEPGARPRVCLTRPGGSRASPGRGMSPQHDVNRETTMAHERPPRAEPQHRDHGPHRRGQDHDDRAHPLLHRQDLQDRRGARGRRGRWTTWSRSRSAASRSRRPPPPRTGTTTASTSSTRRATSTSPSRWSARCACSTARSRCSTASPASSRRPRRCGARPTVRRAAACASSTRWTAWAPTSTTRVDSIKDRLGANAAVLQLPDRRRGRLPRASSTCSR